MINALNKIITSQQTRFLSKRLIDNNIKTIQYLIARHKSNMKSADTKNEITLLFLNQKKTYNKINHEYLKKTLRQIKILENFISWIRMLYKNVFIRLFINNHIKKKISILCEIRQRDSLSYIFFVLMIKRLTRYIAINLTIKRVAMSDL